VHHKRIGIVIIATNSYFVLGIRFIKRFIHFYKGNSQVTFHFFSDTDPKPYLSDNINIKFYPTHHKNWVDGTNSKFRNIVSAKKNLLNEDYIFYFDADTNVNRDFTEDWFVGNLVGGEHYGNRSFEKLPFDRNPKSKAYIPKDTKLDQMYYYGAFFGGNTTNMMEFCKKLIANQIADKSWGYEPGVNDESYINNYFHYNPPDKVVPCDEFQFLISDKGGIGETRKTNLDVKEFKRILRENKDKLFDIRDNKIIIQ